MSGSLCSHLCLAAGKVSGAQAAMIQGLVLLCMCEGGGRWMGPLASTLSYTATCREKPRWSLRPCLRAMCRQTSRDVEAESTMTVRFSPVAKVIWIGMCFLDLTAWGQTKTQVLCPGGPSAQLSALELLELCDGRPAHQPLFPTHSPCWRLPLGSGRRGLLKPRPARLAL